MDDDKLKIQEAFNDFEKEWLHQIGDIHMLIDAYQDRIGALTDELEDDVLVD